MTSTLGGFMILLALLCIVGLTGIVLRERRNKNAAAAALMLRILDTIKGAVERGDTSASLSVPNSPLREFTITSGNTHVVCNCPTEWPRAPDALPLVRMLSGTFGKGVCDNHLDGVFTITHGHGANEGQTSEDMVYYLIRGNHAGGTGYSYVGTITKSNSRIAPLVHEFSEIMDMLLQQKPAPTNSA